MSGSNYFKRSIRARPSVIEGLVRSLLAIAVPTAIRWFIDRGVNGSAFLLYFPAIQMISTFLGWRWGALTAIGSGLAAFLIFPPTVTLPVDGNPAVVAALFIVTAATTVIVGHQLRVSILENAERAQQSDDFNRELQHRTKNSLQIMRALAAQASKATDPAEFYEKLAGRLGALAKANELLRFGALRSCDIADLARAAMAPFDQDQIVMRGPSCQVARDACTPLMMALHELGTNANKYGALSVPDGRVHLIWEIRGDGELDLHWTESGGPPVSPPTRKGLGSRLLSPQGRMTAVETRFEPQGLTCAMQVALDRPDGKPRQR
jgi:two-component sensor histidine kinase